MGPRSPLLDRLGAPRDAASLAAFRMLFGALVSGSALRFLAKGGVDRCFVEPIFFFKYWGFAWVEVGSRAAMTAVFVGLAIVGAMIALGLLYRFATIAFFVGFTYVHLIDVTNYLNHYYLVSLLALLLALVPANRAFALDPLLGLAERRDTVPAWVLWLLRFQVGVVYVGAAIAKINPDWLLHAQPMQIWMSSRQDVPLVGALLGRYEVALALSWAGFLNDLLAVPLLLGRRTRPYAFAMIVVFHACTSRFFNIGIFPILMPIGATLFFDPSWPRAWLARLGRAAAPVTGPVERPAHLLVALLGAYVLAQVALPLRTYAYGGDVLWHEQGMRFSWRVMLRKKNGSITYRVRIPGRRREVEVHPRRYLNDFQEREFAGQPDLIVQLARRIAADFHRRGDGRVEVRVDAWVSLNGRPAARMIDPEVDLARVEDGLAPARYVLPSPRGAPARLASR